MAISDVTGPAIFKPSWTEVKGLIERKVEEICRGREVARLATDIELWVTSDQLPDTYPETSGSMEAHLAYLVGSALSDEDVWMCGEDVAIHIVPASTGAKDEFHLKLTWNLPVPEKVVEEMLRHLSLSIQQNRLTDDHLHSTRQKLLQFCHPGRSK